MTPSSEPFADQLSNQESDWLRAVGVDSVEQLQTRGAITVYQQLRRLREGQGRDVVNLHLLVRLFRIAHHSDDTPTAELTTALLELLAARHSRGPGRSARREDQPTQVRYRA